MQTTSPDSLGNATSQTSTIVITPATAAPAEPVPHTSSPFTLSLTRVTQSHRRWREATRGQATTAVLRKTPVGTRFGFTVNEAAAVTLTFGRVLPGRRVQRRCRALTERDRHDPRCTRTG